MKKLLESYLRFFAKIYLKRANPQIVAITGSAGKTTTKEAIFTVLFETNQSVRKSAGNLNTEIGAPLAILNFQNAPQNFLEWVKAIVASPFKAFWSPKTNILILELAADKPGDIDYLTSFIYPKVAVLTAVGPAHLEAFESVENVVSEKSKLLRALPSDGWAVLNIEDENIKKISYDGGWQRVTYSLGQNSDLWARNIQTKIQKTNPSFSAEIVDSDLNAKISLPILGTKGNVLAVLAAFAVGKIFNLSWEKIILGLKSFKSESHRLEVLSGKMGSIIIDDSYNANPLSLRNALDLMKNLRQNNASRKIVVLGGMHEIGKITNEAHKLLGEYAKTVSDIQISVGELAKNYGFTTHFKEKGEAITYLLSNVKEGDIILIKASRAEKMEEVTEALKE